MGAWPGGAAGVRRPGARVERGTGATRGRSPPLNRQAAAGVNASEDTVTGAIPPAQTRFGIRILFIGDLLSTPDATKELSAASGAASRHPRGFVRTRRAATRLDTVDPVVWGGDGPG